MKVITIHLQDTTVSLRLTASKLAEYAISIGSTGSTLFSVMDALDDLGKQGALFTAALTYNGNTNPIQNGFDLIDMMADADYTPIDVKTLILDLSKASGVISRDDAAKVLAAIKAGNDKIFDAAVAVLSGDASGIADAQKENTVSAVSGESPI